MGFNSAFKGLIAKWEGFGNRFAQHHPLFYNKKQLSVQFHKLIFNFDVFYIFSTSRVHPMADSLVWVRMGYVGMGWFVLGSVTLG